MCGFLRACFARALRILPPPSGPALEGRVVSAAANPAAGVEHVAVHSGRLRLASKLTSREVSTWVSTTDVMLVGALETSRLVRALPGRAVRDSAA